MESVPPPPTPSGEKYLDDNAERFEPRPSIGPAPSKAAFRTKIHDLARELGFVRIGFASAEPFTEAGQRFKQWLGQGHAGTMSCLAELGDRHLPGRFLANARSLVVAAVAVPSAAGTSTRAPLHGKVADYALGLDYHIALRSRLRRIGQGLADFSGHMVWVRPCVDTAPLLEREAARRAGIGFIAKSTMLIVPGVGPRVLLALLVTDLALEPDPPQEEDCGSCTACLEACPTGALVAPYRLDARRCLSCVSIEQSGIVPSDLRAAFGNGLFGCDRCQTACPYDRVDAAIVMPTDASPRPWLVGPDLVRWLEMTATDYRRITKRSALRRVGRIQLMRNATICLGNSGRAEAIAPLIAALEGNPSAVVRAHAAWALGRLRGVRAQEALQGALVRETDDIVCGEIRAALAQLGGRQ
jgi:epoxyqueuosine reductase